MNNPIQIPDDLRLKIEQIAESKGISAEEFVRETLERQVSSARCDDALFKDDAVFGGGAPIDGAANHDDYLYGDAS